METLQPPEIRTTYSGAPKKGMQTATTPKKPAKKPKKGGK